MNSPCHLFESTRTETLNPRKMKTVSRYLAILASLMVLLVACEDSPTEGQPQITGRISLFDELGSQLSSADGVRVGVLTPSSVEQWVAVTDNQGDFSLELPGEDLFDLIIEREGFGTRLLYGLDPDMGPLLERLFVRSSAVVTAVDASAASWGSVNCLYLAMDVDNFFAQGITRRLLRFFLSTDAGVTDFDYEFTGLLVVPEDQPGLVQTGTAASFELGGITGVLEGFESGDTLYMVVHGATENLTNSYPQFGTGPEIFTDLSPASAGTSFIIP